jgi:hypothetical protein
MTYRDKRDRVPIFWNDQSLSDRSRAEQGGGDPTSSQAQGSGQEKDILDRSPDSLVSQSLFQSISMSIRVEAAVFFAQANEDQRRSLLDPAVGFQDLIFDRFDRMLILFQSVAKSLAHGLGKPFFPLLLIEEKKSPGLGVMGGRGPARGLEELPNPLRVHLFRKEFPDGSSTFDEFTQRFHLSNRTIQRISFLRDFSLSA